MKIERKNLTCGQLEKLIQWESEGMPTETIKLGYSIGSRGNNNFHSTWAFRRDGNIYRFYGDGRSTWRKMINKYGFDNVRG